jgi:hypothetical protein
VKKLFAIVFTVALLCIGAGAAFTEDGKLSGALYFGRGEVLNGVGVRLDASVPLAVSGGAEDWISVIVRQDSVQRVLIRLYGKIGTDVAPTDVFADVTGIEAARVWIGDSNGNPDPEGAPAGSYVIIEGTAPSEATAKEARVNRVWYNFGGVLLTQDFSDSPIVVGDMPSGDPAWGRSSGGCDSGFGGFALLSALAACVALRWTKREIGGAA